MTPTATKALRILATPARWISPWYNAYALLGAVSSGLVPVLLPLMIVAASHRIAWVGYIMGGFNLGLLSSPLWGVLADKRRLHRSIFFAGLALVLIALGVLPWLNGLVPWFLAALLGGAGTAAATTMATLFIVEFTPRTDWEPRIGWLQSFNGAGQVAGLLLAGYFASRFNLGLWVSAALMVPALLVGRVGLPSTTAPRRPTGETLHHLHRLDFHLFAAFARTEFQGGGLLHAFHPLTLHSLRQAGKLLPTTFGRFLTSWFALSFGVAAFFAYFPIAMRAAYGVTPATTSLMYAVAAGIGVALYTYASHLSTRFGAGAVYRAGLIVRFAGFALLLALLFLPTRYGVLASAGFILIIIAWPILSVTGTDLSAELSPLSEGTAMGLFNASAAIATVLGTFLGGALVHAYGYAALSLLALTGIALAFALGLGLTPPAHPEPPRT